MKSNKKLILYLFSTSVLVLSSRLHAQELITNIYGRETFSLNGPWQYIVDPYETGFYDYRFKEKHENDPGAYWNSGVPKNKTAMIEHGYDDQQILMVPIP